MFSWTRSIALASAVGAFFFSLEACFAGPPFFTDDPVPVAIGHWEINSYSAGTFVKGTSVGVAPAVDANYGAFENVQLHLIAPLAYARWSDVSMQYGAGDVEVGMKYRLLTARDTDWWPQVGVYPLLDFPTGNADRGLGNGSTRAFIPIWLQKDFGNWTTYGGGGYWINPGLGNENYWFAGWLIEYHVTERLALGGEVFHQSSFASGGPGSAGYPLGSRDSTGFNFGGSYDFTKTYHLLFSFGRGLENASMTNAFSYYLALQSTY